MTSKSQYLFILLILLISYSVSNADIINIPGDYSEIQQGIDAGEFAPGSSLEAAYAIGSIIEGTVMLWLYDPEQIDIQAHIKSSIELLLKGLKSSD